MAGIGRPIVYPTIAYPTLTAAMVALLGCPLLGVAIGVLAALAGEWLAIGYWRRRCWRAEITLRQVRADPDGQALLERLDALRALLDNGEERR